VGVIEFPSRTWFYVREDNRTVINAWLDDIGASESDRSKLRALFTLYQFGGFRAIASSVESIGNDLHVLYSIRKGGLALAPIFCVGPFSQTEITFLEGAMLIDEEIRPYSAPGAALENLKSLLSEPTRRRYERISTAT
jgi:hypothetical protein